MKRAGKHSIKFQDFDIIAFLDDYDIGYTQTGKNVGNNWIGLETCPFCGASGWHFGVNMQSKGFACWVCPEGKGGLPKLIEHLLNIPKREVYEILNKYSGKILDYTIRESGTKLILPSKLKPLGRQALKYLKNRNYNHEIIKKYHLQETGNFSEVTIGEHVQDFKYRIFIPFYVKRELVTYTARDYTNVREPKYRHPVLEAAIIPPASCIYNIDKVKERAIILEGPTDVWRMGDNTLSIQGKTATKEQIRLLAELRLKKLIILLDAEAANEADALANSLYGCADSVQVAYLEKGDPGELDEIDVIKIKHKLLYGE